MRNAGRELAFFGFYLLLAIVLTWPLAIRLSTATSDLGDPLLNTWILNWDLYDATHHVANIFQAPMFYPAKFPLAYSENLFGIALAGLPFYLAGLSPLTVYNILLLLGFALCGYGAFVLVRVATGSARAAIVAGVLYAFVPYHFDHLAHIQIIWGGWLPLILTALLLYWRGPTLLRAAGFGAALLMNGLCNIHYFLFGTLAAALTVFVLAMIDRRAGWRFWIRLAVAGSLAIALMIPVLLPYKTVSELYHMKRIPEEAAYFSATWADWIRPVFASATYGDLAPRDDEHPEHHVFPGLFILFLTAAALTLTAEERGAYPFGLKILDALIVAFAIVSYWGAASPRYVLQFRHLRLLSVSSANVPFTILLVLIFVRLAIRRPLAWRGGLKLPMAFWISVLWIGIGVIGSLGMHAFFHSLLFHRITAFQAIRVPARWAAIAYVGLAVTAGFGAAALMRRRKWLAFGILLAIAIFDVRPRIRYEHALTGIDPAYRWIRDARFRGAMLELPVQEERVEWLYMLSATFHHRLMLNGTSGFYPPSDIRLRHLTTATQWTSELTDLITQLGCSVVVVHDDWLHTASDTAHAWLRRELASGRLIFLRRFDHRTGGDFVFAVAANCPECAALRASNQNDDLDRMLRGEPIYLARTFGYVDVPKAGLLATKSLTVSGWALSPDGIREVDVLLQSATKRYRAILVERGDVLAKYPWYPNVPRPGFTVTLPKRPRGVPRYTDVQVEIVDGRGARTRLPDRFIVW